MPSPEPPLEKKIRRTRQDLKAAKIELDRKIEIQKTIVYLDQLLRDAEAKLACFKTSKADCGKPGFSNSTVCGEKYKYYPGFTLCDWVETRIDHYQARINDLRAKIGRGSGGTN